MSKINGRQVFKSILKILFFMIVYVNLGYLYRYGMEYGGYYPTSWAKKILMPTAPWWSETSPFADSISVVEKEMEKKYESFSSYREAQKSILVVLAWPFIFVLIYFAALISWIVQIFIWIWGGVVFLWWLFFQGGLLQYLGVP